MIQDLKELISMLQDLSAGTGPKDGNALFKSIGHMSTASSNSVMNIAKANICQFPLLVSDGISLSSYSKLAEMLEQLYATYIKMTIVNTAETIDLTKKENKQSVINKIHQNDKLANSVYSGVGDIYGALLGIENPLVVESFEFSKFNKVRPTDIINANKELMKPYLENFNLGYLNGDENNSNILTEDVSQADFLNLPNEIHKQCRILNNYLGGNKVNLKQAENMFKIIEELVNIMDTHYSNNKNASYIDPNFIQSMKTARFTWKQTQIFYKTRIKNLGPSIDDLNERFANGGNFSKDEMQMLKAAKEIEEYNKKINREPSTKFKIDKTILKNNNLEPTIMDIQVTYDNGTSFKDTNIIIGVKCVTHVIPQGELLACIPQTLVKKKPLFRAIQWLTGEIKTSNFVFDVEGQKEDAVSKKNSVRWFRHLKTRSKAAKIRSFTKGREGALIPNATIVLSMADVETMKVLSHIDLYHDVSAVRKLMDILFLMNIVILDDINEEVMLYNNATMDWEHYTFVKLDQEIKASLGNNLKKNTR